MQFLIAASLFLQGNDFDFDQTAFGQLGDFDSGTGGKHVAVDILGIYFVDSAEIIHILNEHQRLDDAVHAQPGFSQNGFDVFQSLLGLRLDRKSVV